LKTFCPVVTCSREVTVCVLRDNLFESNYKSFALRVVTPLRIAETLEAITLSDALIYLSIAKVSRNYLLKSAKLPVVIATAAPVIP